MDLRTKPQTVCTLEAARTVRAEQMAANTAQELRCTPARVEVLRTRGGSLARLTIGNRQFVALSGNVDLAEPVWECAGVAPVRLAREWGCTACIPQPAPGRRTEGRVTLCICAGVWYNKTI